MGDRLTAAAPTESRADLNLGSAVGGLRLAGLRGNVQETHLAQAELARCAPPAVDGQANVSGRHAAEFDGRVRRVRGPGGGLGKLHAVQNRPVGPVLGKLDGHVPESETEDQLKLGIVVPHEHLVQLVDATELKLNVQGLIVRGTGQPHVRGLRRVLIVLIQPGAVDRPLRRGNPVRNPVAAGHNALNRIGERFRREAPDGALDDGVVRRRHDFVDPPVVRRIEIEHTRRVIAGRRLALADERTSRIGSAGVVHIVKDDAEVDVVRSGRLAGRPFETRRPPHIHGAIGRLGSAGHACVDDLDHLADPAAQQHSGPIVHHIETPVRVGVSCQRVKLFFGVSAVQSPQSGCVGHAVDVDPIVRRMDVQESVHFLDRPESPTAVTGDVEGPQQRGHTCGQIDGPESCGIHAGVAVVGVTTVDIAHANVPNARGGPGGHVAVRVPVRVGADLEWFHADVRQVQVGPQAAGVAVVDDRVIIYPVVRTGPDTEIRGKHPAVKVEVGIDP